MYGLYPNDASMLDSIGRLMIVALFLIIGIRNLQKFHVDDHVARLTKFKAPLPKVTFWVGQIMEFIAIAMVLFNWHADIGVILLIVFTVVASLLLLRFWEVDVPPMRVGMQNGMVANIAVVGGLLLLLQNVRSW
jgi:putative oxidoreductase